MGNENQSQQKNGDISISINHPKFQNAKLVTQSKQKQLQITLGVDEKQYEKWKQNVKFANLDPNYLLLPKKQQFNRKGFCGDSGTLKMNFQNYSYLLTEEIYNRNGKKAPFEQQQLWYLLLVLSAAQQEMKLKTGTKVGDIRPHNIFLNADGQAKISCTYSWPRQITNFNKTFDNQRTYLAPQDMVRLQMGTLQDSNTYQGEVFSIGLTLLSAAMLQDFLRLYNTKTYKFDLQEANAALEQWKQNTVYSQIFTAFVANLCQFKPQKRLDDEQLWKWISQYQSQIKNKQDFYIQSPPAKIQQQIQEIRKLFPNQEPQLPHPQQQTVIPVNNPFPDKSVVSSYNPPFARPYQEIPLNYINTNEPRLQNQVFPQNLPISNNKQFFREEQVSNVPVLSPRLRASQNINQIPQFKTNPPPQIQQFRQISQGQLPRQVILQKNPQNQSIQHYYEQSPISPNRFTVPTPIIYGAVPQQIKQMRPPFEQPRFIPNSINTANQNESMLPPQFVGRTINQTYIANGGETRTYHQSYAPEFQNVKQQQQQGLSFFQNVIDPQGLKGGRIEETVYIQRPEYISNVVRYQ